MRCVGRDHNRRIKAKAGQPDACPCARQSSRLRREGRENRGLHASNGEKIRKNERHLPVADNHHMLGRHVLLGIMR
jgi:hypothetical protein